jgi:hypothetical protein
VLPMSTLHGLGLAVTVLGLLPLSDCHTVSDCYRCRTATMVSDLRPLLPLSRRETTVSDLRPLSSLSHCRRGLGLTATVTTISPRNNGLGLAATVTTVALPHGLRLVAAVTSPSTHAYHSPVDALIRSRAHSVPYTHIHTHTQSPLTFTRPLFPSATLIHHSAHKTVCLLQIIEILFQESLLKVLFATETFALGVNMPAKTVIFTQLQVFSVKICCVDPCICDIFAVIRFCPSAHTAHTAHRRTHSDTFRQSHPTLTHTETHTDAHTHTPRQSHPTPY